MAIFQEQGKKKYLDSFKKYQGNSIQQSVLQDIFYIYDLIFSSLLYIVKVGKVSLEYV